MCGVVMQKTNGLKWGPLPAAATKTTRDERRPEHMEMQLEVHVEKVDDLIWTNN